MTGTALPDPADPIALHREGFEGWGMLHHAVSDVAHPTSAAEIAEVFRLARATGRTVGFWGNGRSYADAALNDGQIVLDFRRMNRVLELDRETGEITVEPGITLQDLWQHVLPYGFWPSVVSGTMYTTVGGLCAANAHGKNNFAHGPIGDHVLRFELVLADGEVRTVDRDSDPTLFHAVIGGFGLLGAFASITLQLERVYSGRIKVQPFSCSNLDQMFRGFERCNESEWDYVVGWLDAFGTGNELGRGQIHAARYAADGEDPEARAYLSLDHQEASSAMFGIVPKRWAWFLMRPFANRLGFRLINAARYWWASSPSRQHAHLQPHAQFNFLLDFVPNWWWCFKPHGLIQYQLFVPLERAPEVFRRALELQQELRQESTLLVMKRHRPDAFLMSHAIDGYSLAMDFKVTPRNREVVYQMTRRFEALIVEAGGRFYFAKDAVVTPDAVREVFGERLARFLWIKAQVDPHTVLQGNLWRRVFAPLLQQVRPLAPHENPVPTEAEAAQPAAPGTEEE